MHYARSRKRVHDWMLGSASRRSAGTRPRSGRVHYVVLKTRRERPRATRPRGLGGRVELVGFLKEFDGATEKPDDDAREEHHGGQGPVLQSVRMCVVDCI